MTSPRLLALVLALPVAAAFANAVEARRAAELRESLATSEPEAVKAIAIDLISRNEQDTTLLDVVADRIAAGQTTREAELADALAWLCRVIANARAGRYRQFLDTVSDTAGTVRLRHYAAVVAVGLPDTGGPPYAPAPPPAPPPPPPPKVEAKPVPVPPPKVEAQPIPPPQPQDQSAAQPLAAPARVNAIAGGSYRLRDGVQLRTRPLASGLTLDASPGAVRLVDSSRNAEGIWWFVKGEHANGWVRESDLTTP